MNNNAFGNKFAFKHGHATKGHESSTYRTWSQMLSRCRNKNHKDYKWYGGRGIKVCRRWIKFELFLEDMGEKPLNTTIDRINNSKNYYKNNCRWATQKVQHRNKRSNRLVTFQGKTYCISEWAEIVGMSRCTLWDRLYKHTWSIQKSLTSPVRKWRRKCLV